MKPEKQPKIPQEDLFRMRLENMLDINHELIKLSKHIDWESLDKEWGALDRLGGGGGERDVEGLDVQSRFSSTGRRKRRRASLP